MAVASSYDLLQGGLDLVTPAMAVPAGRAIAAMNYEPEARGYRRIGGLERFDGQPAPSGVTDPEQIAARRAAIKRPAGVGPVRGVHIYENALYCFRDSETGEGQMFRATAVGWERLNFGHTVNFNGGTVEFTEGETLHGVTSNAFATIERVVLRSGQWNGTASGFLVITMVAGAFGAEAATDTKGGAANVSAQTRVELKPGGRYDILIHNFYGSAKRRRLYFVSGADTGYEFDGRVLSPVFTGNSTSAATSIIPVLTRDGSTVLARNGDIVGLRGLSDNPIHIGVHSNHLFLGFEIGALIHSGVGEPLDFRAAAGASEISLGASPTGILSSVSTTLVVFGQSRVDYLVGTDSDKFELKPITENAGASRWSAQVAGEAPIYLDEGGLRKLTTTSAFGDWRMGTLSRLIEPLISAKRKAGARVTATVTVKSKDQFRIFFDDCTGIVLYLGREKPELMPIRFPSAVTCTCVGEFIEGDGERIFYGSEDGFVYEMDSGPSFDGAAVPAYLRLAWNAQRSPNMEKRFHSANVETDSLSPMSVGFTYHVDYNATENLDGELRNYAVAAGSPDLTPAGATYGAVDWQVAAAGELKLDDVSGLGRNIALTFLTEHTTEEPHTFTALTLNYSQRRQLR